jgi:hypothetical protein
VIGAAKSTRSSFVVLRNCKSPSLTAKLRYIPPPYEHLIGSTFSLVSSDVHQGSDLLYWRKIHREMLQNVTAGP